MPRETWMAAPVSFIRWFGVPSLPGVGYQLMHASFQRDYPVVQASTLLIAGTFVVVSFLVDVLYGVLDPRIRLA